MTGDFWYAAIGKKMLFAEQAIEFIQTAILG